MLDALSVEEGCAAFRTLRQNRPAIAHPNRRLVTPLWQGDGCEGLSSLFAIINAIQLAIADRHILTAPERHALMNAGLRCIDGRMSCRQLILAGARVQLWRQLAEGVAYSAERMTGIRICAERVSIFGPWTRVAALDALACAVTAMRVPLILFQGGHYTAVSGFTVSSILLFDSAGKQWVSKHTCGVPGDCAGAGYVLFPASFMTLTA